MSNNRTNLDKDILLKAFDTARAWSGLLITLSTGAIVFTAIFKRGFSPTNQPIEFPCLLITTWIILGLSVVLGVTFLGVLSTTLNKGKQADLDLYNCTCRGVGLSQVILFLIGIGTLIAFLMVNMY